jgi:hypothetical protein
MSRVAPHEAYRGAERRQIPTTPRSANLGPERRWDARKQLYPQDDSLFLTRPAKNETATAVYHALEFISKGTYPGSLNPFREIVDASHDVEVAANVYFALNAGHKLDIALDLVAREHPQQCGATPRCATISRSTVARAWRKHAAGFTSNAR